MTNENRGSRSSSPLPRVMWAAIVGVGLSTASCSDGIPLTIRNECSADIAVRLVAPRFPKASYPGYAAVSAGESLGASLSHEHSEYVVVVRGTPSSARETSVPVRQGTVVVAGGDCP